MVILLKVFALVCVAVGLLHVVLGLQADNLLGANLAPEVIANPSLDSQNRFYGACFTLFGFATLLACKDLRKHNALFRMIMTVFFCGSIARLVSLAIYDLLSPTILALLVIEIVLPIVMMAWHGRTYTPTEGQSD